MAVTGSHADAGVSDGPDDDAVVVGAGFAGLSHLHRLRDELGLSVKFVEKADDLGRQKTQPDLGICEVMAVPNADPDVDLREIVDAAAD
jgi:flavin-dependent dehydrogenase